LSPGVFTLKATKTFTVLERWAFLTKYYGWKATAFVVGIFYFAMAAAALIIEFVFRILGLVPQERKAQVVEASISLNYTTVLNIIFLMVAGFLVIRFLKTGGPKMLVHMD